MSLFPQSFLDDLKAQLDIIAIVGETVALRKRGATWTGLCPFHTEKTPSFSVSQDKGSFKCFGCDAGGDVVSFIQRRDKLSFPEAVRYLAGRAGIQVPEGPQGSEERAAAADREALLAVHDRAAAFFRDALQSPAGLRARRELESRGLSAETIGRFGYGYAPAAGRLTLHRHLTEAGVPIPVQIRSGLVKDVDGHGLRDQFRHRLMIPISRDSGSVVAFGGRALDEGQVPKYLNSPETPLYSKGRMLYGLDVTKAAIRTHNYCVLVEGYFDLAQVWQAGVQPVAALCGTALTPAQARTLKRFTSKVVLSLDPDAAGQGAAARSSELLVAEGFDVNVALLPDGRDPDAFIRQMGARAYAERLTGSRRYLDFLLDRAAERFHPSTPDGRKPFLDAMLKVAATIPDAAERDRFGDALAHKAGVTEGVIRDEVRKAAVSKRTEAPAVVVASSQRVSAAEQGLLWALAHRPVEGLAALGHFDPDDAAVLVAGSILTLAASLTDVPADVLPNLLRERLTEEERALFDAVAREGAPAAAPADCLVALQRDRTRRGIAALQDRIDRLQSSGGGETIEDLWQEKKVLLQRLDALNG